MSARDLGASIRAKLLARAKDRGEDFTFVLTRYAMERLLYRVGISPYADRFLLKGALVFELWYHESHRPTRDIDLLAFGAAEIPALEEEFKEIAAIQAEDGIVFDPASIKAKLIREEARYGGIRITLRGSLAGARIPIQIDVGFGDAVTPEPEETEYPPILDGFPAPRIRAYPSYTVIAEKFEAMVILGLANSRMKDFFDLWIMAQRSEFDGAILSQAILATFRRRNTPISPGLPFGLSPGFSSDARKTTQWRAFLKRNGLEASDLADVISLLAKFLGPPWEAISSHNAFNLLWHSNQEWVHIVNE